VSPATGDQDIGRPAPGVTAFAEAWAAALRATCYVPLTRAERHQLLARLTHQLAVSLAAEPFDPTAGYWVGAELVSAGFAAPETLHLTMATVRTRLLADLGRADRAWRERLAGLVETLAAGFTSAVRDRTLDEQDSIRLASLTAVARAGRALRDSEQRFRHLASHDPLTGLPNRTQFSQWLRAAVAAATPADRLGVCCIDLDGFEAINTSLGHDVGDRLLVAVADRLRKTAGTSGHLTARLDSDKFAVLVEATTCPEDAIKVVDQMLSGIAAPVHLGDHELQVTASAGVVEQPVAGAEPADLLRAADIALCWAKADGKARWTRYEEDRSARDAGRYRLTAAMPGALRDGQFRLAYQPLVRLADGRMVGVEALARWDHPDQGELGASQFIGLAEDTGLIVSLGAYLLERACRQAATWSALTDDPPYVSVNLAARQLRHPALVATVLEVLDRTGIDPALLQLELTEQATIAIDDESIALLRQLAGLGIRVALDDFGTGYANLDCLYNLPLHGIKLASTFVPAGDEPDLTFLRTVVALAHSRGLQVTAEGIESPAQARLLRTVGCDSGQGWFFGRPVSAEAITRLLSTEH
jgi:diguanylate cyclase (GGDEF)-like protein